MPSVNKRYELSVTAHFPALHLESRGQIDTNNYCFNYLGSLWWNKDCSAFIALTVMSWDEWQNSYLMSVHKVFPPALYLKLHSRMSLPLLSAIGYIMTWQIASVWVDSLQGNMFFWLLQGTNCFISNLQFCWIFFLWFASEVVAVRLNIKRAAGLILKLNRRH